MNHHQQHAATPDFSEFPFADPNTHQHNVTAAQMKKALGMAPYTQGFYVRLAIYDGSGNVINGSNVTQTQLKGLDTAQGSNDLRTINQVLAAAPVNGNPVAIQVSPMTEDDSRTWTYVSTVLGITAD